MQLASRMQCYVDRGWIPRLPTRWQRFQGQLEMAGYVVTPDPKDAERYADAPLGNPVLRQPLIISQIGFDHFRVGDGLGTPAAKLWLHLAFVYHLGMPLYDLQLLQTLPGGLEGLRRNMQETQDGTTATGRRRRRLIDLVIPQAAAYRQRFLEPGGYIDRAEAYDYPRAEDEAPCIRPEFLSVVNFLNHCARAYPAQISDVGYGRLGGHLAALATTRWRVGEMP